MKFKRILSIFVSMFLFVSMVCLTKITTYAVSDLKSQVIEKCEKNPRYRFTITKYLPEVRISIFLGLEQGFIDLRNPKDSIIDLLDIDERTFDSYFHSNDAESLINEFFYFIRDVELYFKK